MVVGILPIVISRVYDSSASDTGDFGPGWRLSIAETISLQADGSALLVDESGSVTRFVERGGQYVQDIPHPSDIVSLKRRNGYIFEMKLTSGMTKRYRLSDGAFRLSEVADRNGNSIRLQYRDGRLSGAERMNKRLVRFDRDGSGRIARVTDDQGRSAVYNYDAQGQLVQVLDLGGNAWSYTYGPDGRLSTALDPLSYLDISIQFDSMGRVAEVIHRGQKTRYEYHGNTSRIIDVRDRVSAFTQNEAGITITALNHVGVTTTVEMDEANRVSTLRRNDVTRATFSYDAHGRLVSSRLLTDHGLQTIAYRHDGAGRLISAVDDGGDLHLSLRYDPRGNVRSVERGEEKSAYRYAPDGALKALWRPDGSHYSFETDADGQITKVTDDEGRVIELSYLPAGRLGQTRFADGSTHIYGYGDVGLREFTQPSDAKLLRSYYDASGNLNLLEHVSSSGDVQSDYYGFDETNRLNRVDYVRSGEDSTTNNARELTYDAAGEVVAEQIASKDLRFSYDAQDRLVAVADGAKQLIYRYVEDEPDIRLQLDEETRVSLLPWSNTGLTIGASHEVIHNRTRLAPYQTIWLDTDLNVFRVVSDIALTLPHRGIEDSLRRMRLLELGEASFTDKAQFSRPSNILFIPGEFRWINCYTPPFPGPDPCQGYIPPFNSVGVATSEIESDLEDNPQCGGVGPSVSVGISKTTIRPLGTGGTNSAAVTITCLPGRTVRLSLASASSGGHSSHSGTRPLGTLAATSGTADSMGKFSTTFTASHFGGSIKISATVNTETRSANILVDVPDTASLGAGSGYQLIGQTATHQTNHYGTATTLNGLRNIASDYMAAFFSGTTMPSGDALRYNDMSLLNGGKFELPSNWCTNCSHFEHAIGRNSDVGSSNVPTGRRAALEDIFSLRGSPNFLDETATANHWHLRF